MAWTYEYKGFKVDPRLNWLLLEVYQELWLDCGLTHNPIKKIFLCGQRRLLSLLKSCHRTFYSQSP